MTALELHDLACAYDRRPVVERVSLEAQPGQVLALIGPNGAGKSTLLRAMARLLKPVRGKVILATKLSGDHSAEHLKKAIENSLRSLRTDYIDLYQLHQPRPETPIVETMAGMARLSRQASICSWSRNAKDPSRPMLIALRAMAGTSIRTPRSAGLAVHGVSPSRRTIVPLCG